MFGKPTLKNRFESLESRLSDSHETKPHDPVAVQTKHPVLQASLRADHSPEEFLSSYIQDMKTTFDRVHVREMSDNSLAFENEVSQLINKLTKKPCLIQIIHPMNKKGLENFKLLILALNESGNHWRMLLKDLSWVGVSFATSSAVLTFDQNSNELSKLEGLLKMISSRSNHVSSFNIQKKNSQFTLSLRLESYVNRKISTERDTAI